MEIGELRVHFVFTGGEFSYAYYIGVMTALQAQSAPVVLWVAADPEPRSRYFELVPAESYDINVLTESVED